MAWIKVEHCLHEKPEVAEIAATLGLEIDTVVGKLLRVWQWYDRHTDDGCAKVALEFHDRIAAHNGFAQAMQKAGWLCLSANGLLSVPKFDRHNSKSAKRRVLAAESMQRSRCASRATNTPPEKIREEKNKETKAKKRMFNKPTVEQVNAYCLEQGNGIAGQDFIDHYDRVGWVVGRNQTPMKNWKAAVRVWERHRKPVPSASRLLTPEEKKRVTLETLQTGVLADA